MRLFGLSLAFALIRDEIVLTEVLGIIDLHVKAAKNNIIDVLWV